MALGHLSLYQLTIEPETPFYHLHQSGKLRIPGAELSADLYEVTQELCEAAGLPAYEVSNHASAGTGKPAQSDLLALWRLRRRWALALMAA